jgi:hypothetical protein
LRIGRTPANEIGTIEAGGTDARYGIDPFTGAVGATGSFDPENDVIELAIERDA